VEPVEIQIDTTFRDKEVPNFKRKKTPLILFKIPSRFWRKMTFCVAYIAFSVPR
jgi:hypothetical protein